MSQTVSIYTDNGYGSPFFAAHIYNVATAKQKTKGTYIYFFDDKGHMLAGINPARTTHDFKGDIQS
jgi:hypothetical protein